MEHSRLTFLLLLANILILGASSNLYDDFHECLTDQFRRSNSATDIIYTPQNSTYTTLLLAQNLRPQSTSPERPDLIVTPYHESEVLAAIYCSKKLGMQIRVRSGGHDYEGLSYTSEIPFVMVDMRNFRTISIDSEDKTAWIQVGATLGQVYYTLAQKSKTLAFPAGVCPTVGVGGHFSGGGYGMMSRKNAIAADHIIDAKLINADGKILDRRTMGEDLFWAIRGGGGTSFGIIVEFKVSLVTIPEIVTVFNVTRTSERSVTQLVDQWQHIADKVDENLLLRLFLAPVRSSMGNVTIAASFTSLTPQGLFSPSYFKGKSDYVSSPIPVNGLREIWKILYEEENSQLQFSPYGGVLNTFSESETPFPHRKGNIFMIHYGVGWVSLNESQQRIDWMRKLYSFMGRYVTKSPRAAYFNYRDLDIGRNNVKGTTSYNQASVWGLKYFKNNFRRLVRVKTKVDPSNFFRNEQSVPPLSSK
ncbi:hypothetical protein ACS0TY_019135 [Phlomoides rotata]